MYETKMCFVVVSFSQVSDREEKRKYEKEMHT
jgi:hypothetical protein